MHNGIVENPQISVIIPLYQEAENLDALLDKLSTVLDSLGETYELILVDDGSTDSTWQLIKQRSAGNQWLRGIRLSKNFGKEPAIIAGLECSRGAAVIVMDGDLQHPPEQIPQMVKIWQAGEAEVVEAVKTDRGPESLSQKVSAKLFYFVLNILSGYDLDNSSDFKLMDRKVVDSLLEMGEQNVFFRGMSAWLGFQRLRVPFSTPKRAGGKSGWSFLRRLKLSIVSITAFSSIPLRFVTLAGVVFFILSIFLGVQTLFLKFTGRAVSGFTTVILLQLIIGGLLMIGLGIIGEYVAQISQEVKGRPRFIVTERIH